MADGEIKVGIGVMVLKEGRVLLGKRKGAHGEGEYAFPGGRLEYGESFEDCARREIAEECGIEVDGVTFQMASNLLSYPPTQWVHIGMLAAWKAGEPAVLEPHKCDGWGWYALDALPSPMFATAKTAIDCYRQGTHYVPTS